MRTVPALPPFLALLAAVLALGSVARADWTLTRADATEQRQLTVNTWTANEGLSVTGPGGNLVKVPSRDVVSLLSDRKITASTKEWRLVLRNGDVLFGDPVGVNGQALEFNVAELGKIGVPLKSVQAIVNSDEATPAKPTASDKDTVRLNNNDKVEGLVATVNDAKLQIATGNEADGGVTDIAMNLVKQISFGGATPPRTVPPLSARLTFSAGSVLTVPMNGSFNWTISDISFNDPAGISHKIAADQIARIDLLGGRVVYLTELDPSKDEQFTFIGSHWPTRINHNVLGGPLTIGDTTYARGIGVHTHSALVYDLDGSFDTLRFRVGMDDTAAPDGEAAVSVLLDGKVIWQKSDLKTNGHGGEATEEISLPIKGGKSLELLADPVQGSGKLDVLGRVDWVNIALVRP